MKKLIMLTLMVGSVFYCNAQLSWLKLPDYPGAGKLGVIGMALNGKGYMGLGYSTLGTASNEWYEYNPGTNAWTAMAPLPSVGRWSPAFFTIGSYGYVCTGAIDGSITNETWRYDPVANSWTRMANVPGPVRINAVGFAIGNKGYVGTGYSANTTYNDFYEYDPVSDMWTQKANLPGLTRSGASGFAIGSKGYLGMGNNTNSTSNFQDFYEYDPATDSWSQKADFPLPYVVVPTTYASSNDGYSLGGYYYQYAGITHNPLNMLYKYNQANDEWTLSGTFCGLPRGYAGGFSLSNDMYIGSGAQRNDASPASMLTDFWKLTNGLTLRIENPGTYSDFDIYPNPAFETISIDNSIDGRTMNELRIYDVSGKFLFRKDLVENMNIIDISTLASGMYFVELASSKGEVLDSRFIKE
ncbi:MAG TPA: kelch repeat-containing protein [Bacteroidia bacterium]|nr:kelch repeat-containing protein [Bacteroidia bacterium]